MMKTMIATLLTFTALTAYGQDLTEKVKAYEASQPVKKTLTFMHNNVLDASEGKCASYVRQGYMAGGMMQYPGIDYAKDYLPFLTRSGWTNLVTSAKVKSDLHLAPKGCAIIYEAINPQNDRNGYIGHIEVRTKGIGNDGYISDYFSQNPRSGLECIKKGKVIVKTITFTARDSSPFHRAGSKVIKKINVTTCNQYSNKGALVSDEAKNRKVVGVSCKLN
jgi:hypothetical protein